MNTVVKVEFNNDLRRLTLSGHSFLDLENKVREIFSIEGKFTLKYKDLDGDDITISSDEELSSALVEFAPLKLKVYLSQKATSTHEARTFHPIKEKVYETENQPSQNQGQQQQQQQQQSGKRKSNVQDGNEEDHSNEEVENLFRRAKKLAETTQKIITENPEIMKEAEEISKQFSNIFTHFVSAFQEQSGQSSGPNQFQHFFNSPHCSGAYGASCYSSASGNSSQSSQSFSTSGASNTPTATQKSSGPSEPLYPNLSETFRNLSVEEDFEKYKEHLKTLNSMGFFDESENLNLLKRFKGDIQKVVNYLFSQ